jgi:hypothetical protein
MEEELEKVKKEAQKGWEEFQRGQKACAAAWKEEKERLQALKLRVPKKPKAVIKREWIAANYPQLASLASDMVRECGGEEDEPIGDNNE